MPRTLKNVIAVITGIIIGSIVNMLLINLSGKFVPVPEGVNPTDMESLRANIHLFQPINFLFPFLAHAAGTFVGAFVAALIAATHKMKFALGIGVWFLISGIAMTFLVPAPAWFIALDLLVAYLPMAYLGGKLALLIRPLPSSYA